MSKFKKVLLKLSGESLAGSVGHGIDVNKLEEYAAQIKVIQQEDVSVGIVIGGGNIFRGLQATQKGFDRVKGDYMGMLATTINALAMQSALESLNVKTSLLTAISMEPVGEGYSKRKCLHAFENSEVVIFSAGTGNPYFTTDSAAALRAVEMEADVLLKGTRVDGIYSADPEIDHKATKYDSLTFDEAYKKGLKIMDLTAFTMCMENNLPIIVFNMDKPGNLKELIFGKKIGTIVRN